MATKTKYLSLLEWLAEAGGFRLFKNQRDTVGAGDLRALGVEAWHRAAPFRKKLARLDSGLCPDDAALAAWEAGYFPELTERPDIQDLIDVVARELSGDPVYTLEDRQEIFNAEMRAHERELTSAGARV